MNALFASLARNAYYVQDGIIILCADNESVREQLLSVPDALFYTDPPYGVGERTARASHGRSNLAACNDFAPVEGDDREFDPTPWLSAKRLVLWGANHYAHRLPPSSSWLAWDKRDGMAGNDNADCELAWTNLGGPARLFHHVWNGMIRASEKAEPRTHPTQKPIALAQWAIQMVPAARVVIDPYMGSGSTLLAARDLGLPAIGVELNAGYCESAKQRLLAMSLSLFARVEPTKRCSGCGRLLKLVVNETFNRHARQPDGFQPFCRSCDYLQKVEPEKAWRSFQRALEQRGRGETALWTAETYYRTLGQQRTCHYCHCDVTEWNGGYWIDKIDPNGLYEPSNCVPCCWPCNVTKSNRNSEAWHLELAALKARYPDGKIPWGQVNPKFERRRYQAPDLSEYVVSEANSQMPMFGTTTRRAR